LNDGLCELKSGATIYADVRGGGPPVVFISGHGDDHTLFDPVVADLSRRYRCLTFDNRGSGLSSGPEAPFSMAAWADDAHLLATQLGFAPCVAVGCSMGGAIALEWSLRHPDDLRGLVLIDTWAKTDTYLAAVSSHWSRLAAAGELERLAESMMLLCVSAQYLVDNPRAESEFLSELISDPAGFVAQGEACIAHDTLDRLGQIAVPTLVIAGRHDLLMRLALTEQLAQGIRGAAVALVDAGHVPFWERPLETVGLVSEFLASVLRPEEYGPARRRP
jgi:3-oxoadipate enol-lactonase